MALTETPLCDFGWKARDFELDGVDGQRWRLADARGPRGLLVMFLCNHCPYVKGCIDRLVADVRELQNLRIGAIAIMPNDTTAYPADSFENMARFAREHGFAFPYVIDADQAVARAYGAVCTPDFFGFNADLALQYRGRLDSGGRNPRPEGAPRELVAAMRQVAETGQGPTEQHASMGCSIKWAA